MAAGWRVPVGLLAAAAVIDAASLGLGLHAVGWLNFATVWLFAHQLGFWWRDGGLRRGHGVALLAAGLLGLVGLTTTLGYPVSMVGGAADRSNNTPPTIALAALALGQLGALILVRARLTRWLQRRGPWQATVAANGVAMTTYLWHLTALCLAALVLLPRGIVPQPDPGTGAWWLLRPLWLPTLALFLVPLLALWGRIERRAPAPERLDPVDPPGRRPSAPSWSAPGSRWSRSTGSRCSGGSTWPRWRGSLYWPQACP